MINHRYQYIAATQKPWYAIHLDGIASDFVDWENATGSDNTQVFKSALMQTSAELDKQSLFQTYPYAKKNIMNNGIPIYVRAAALLYLYYRIRGNSYDLDECIIAVLFLYYNRDLDEMLMEDVVSDIKEKYERVFHLTRPVASTAMKKLLWCYDRR